ncbi:MAG: TIGR04282 family arsenosugar biosynthesis glycosyltransferase [Paralcaligenes sp.]
MNIVRIVIFAKAPVAGLVKTRLIPALGAQAAADLARLMLLRTLEKALAVNAGPVELCVSPSQKEAVWQSIPVPATVAWSSQGEGVLGVRMARATRRITDAGESILLIGTDCPELSTTHLRCAVTSLQQHDAVLAPTFDGGYALLGLNQFDASVFEDIAWGTDTVLSETQLRLAQLKWLTHYLPTMHDIDEPEDLHWLPELDASSFLPQKMQDTHNDPRGRLNLDPL